MIPFEIKRLGKEHISDVALVERVCFDEPWSENSLQMLLGDGGFGFVAVSEAGQTLAYGGALTVLDEGQITDIAVMPEYRGQGIGMAIVQAITAHCTRLGLSTLTLEVRESNQAARSLYLSCGFEECGERKDFYRRPRESAIIMSYKIEKIPIKLT